MILLAFIHTDTETASGDRITAFSPSGILTAQIYAFFFWSGKIGPTPNWQARSDERSRVCVCECARHL